LPPQRACCGMPKPLPPHWPWPDTSSEDDTLPDVAYGSLGRGRRRLDSEGYLLDSDGERPDGPDLPTATAATVVDVRAAATAATAANAATAATAATYCSNGRAQTAAGLLGGFWLQSGSA
jgi:hypothetical protein